MITLFFSVSKVKFFTFAGFKASSTNSFGSELQRMMSTFSLLSSRTMFFTRDPRMLPPDQLFGWRSRPRSLFDNPLPAQSHGSRLCHQQFRSPRVRTNAAQNSDDCETR